MYQDIMDFRLLEISGTSVTVGTVLTAIGLVLVAWILSRVLQRTVASAIRRRKLAKEGSLAALQRLTHYTVMFIGAAIALETVGVSLSALFAAGAIFAVGLGFAMQNIAQNFVSGVILLLEHTTKPGDIIQVNDTIVRVQKMGIRATIARTLDDEELIVPNSMLVQSSVKNHTLSDSNYRVRVSVGVTYASDMKLVRDTLERVARAMRGRLQEKEPVVLMTSFGSSSVDFEVSVWIDDPWGVRQAKSELHEGMWWALKGSGVTIAFPQLDVHLDEQVVESLRSRPATAA